MDAFKAPRRCIVLFLIVTSLPDLLLPASGGNATGRFEVYCDGVGFFLAKIADAPAPGRLVLFSYLIFGGFGGGTYGGRHIGQGTWRKVSVMRDGCVPDGRCESIAYGRVWVDAWDTTGAEDKAPNVISGRYEFVLNGKHLEGRFVAKRLHRKHPLRICM